MNRLFYLALFLAGAWYLWRRVARSFRSTRPARRQPGTVTNHPVTLERDPVTGVFRPPEG